MSKSPPLLSPSWYEVDNLQENNEQRPSQNLGKGNRGKAPLPHLSPTPVLIINPMGM